MSSKDRPFIRYISTHQKINSNELIYSRVLTWIVFANRSQHTRGIGWGAFNDLTTYLVMLVKLYVHASTFPVCLGPLLQFEFMSESNLFVTNHSFIPFSKD